MSPVKTLLLFCLYVWFIALIWPLTTGRFIGAITLLILGAFVTIQMP